MIRRQDGEFIPSAIERLVLMDAEQLPPAAPLVILSLKGRVRTAKRQPSEMTTGKLDWEHDGIMASSPA